jgi:carboxylate-amine ligase
MEYDSRSAGSLGAYRLFFQRMYGRVGAVPRQSNGSFSFGIEEEYFLVETATNEAVLASPEALFDSAHLASEGRIGREFLQSQVEAATPPYTSLSQARAELGYIRGILGAIAAEHGYSILACGTHPTAQWAEARHSGKERYHELMDDLQMLGRRNMLCGMHVHVEVPDPNRRIDVMRRMIPYIPLFLALSTSSPFWQSRLTGLKGYRLAAYDELPRTGIPELFCTQHEFEAYVGSLVQSGAMKDSSYVWWSIRPSAKYPTLELRAPDCCTRLDDAIAIAALYRVLVHHLYRNADCNHGIDVVARAVAIENKWRAQRYGVGGSFVTAEGAVAVGEFLEQAIAMTAEDAEILGCATEVAHCRTIVSHGTSADRQIEIYEERLCREEPDAALSGVVEWIAKNTVDPPRAAP